MGKNTSNKVVNKESAEDNIISQDEETKDVEHVRQIIFFCAWRRSLLFVINVYLFIIIMIMYIFYYVRQIKEKKYKLHCHHLHN